MKIQQIRNATIRIECAGKHFLIDPWFQKKGTGMIAPSPDPERAKIPSPTTELPFPVEQIMEGIDAMIVTHIHPDHFDPETAAMLDKSIPVFAVNEETKTQIEGFGYTSVMVLKDEGTDFDGVVLIRTEAMHGESPDQAAGRGSAQCLRCGADGAWAPHHGGRGCFEGMRGRTGCHHHRQSYGCRQSCNCQPCWTP